MAVHGVDVVVADQVDEAGVVAAEAPPGGRPRGGGRRPERERCAEQAGAAQESASRHALGIQVGGGDAGSAQLGSCCSVMVMIPVTGVSGS
ncbi:hypothetical protein [Streptomyces sp. NPDC056660]|uniref:hypothetical protein n=1 Tax=Streptomyces sp. NPDC056660 TaxID=3345897 RepID=UPI0036BDEB62